MYTLLEIKKEQLLRKLEMGSDKIIYLEEVSGMKAHEFREKFLNILNICFLNKTYDETCIFIEQTDEYLMALDIAIETILPMKEIIGAEKKKSWH